MNEYPNIDYIIVKMICIKTNKILKKILLQMYSISMGYLIFISVLGFLFNTAIIILFLTVKKVKYLFRNNFHI